MASFRKRGDSWRIEIYKGGIRESETFPAKREAQEWAARHELELSEVVTTGVVAKPLKDVLEQYRDEISPGNKGKRWDRFPTIGNFAAGDEVLTLVTVELSSISRD